MTPNIQEWLVDDRKPDNIYALLGLPLFTPAGDDVRNRIHQAMRQLLRVQGGISSNEAARAADLQRDLARAELIFGEPSRLAEYERQLIAALRQRFQATAGPHNSLAYVHRWLTTSAHVDPQRLNEIAASLVIAETDTANLHISDTSERKPLPAAAESGGKRRASVFGAAPKNIRSERQTPLAGVSPLKGQQAGPPNRPASNMPQPMDSAELKRLLKQLALNEVSGKWRLILPSFASLASWRFKPRCPQP